MLYRLTTGGKMALQELVIVNPGRKSRRSTTKTRKVKNMARRRTTRRKAAPRRRATTRRRRTTKRRAAPKRRKTTRRRKTTKRRAAPKRRRTTRRKTTTRRRRSPARRRTTRRRSTTRRRRSPARRKTTRRRRRSPARRRTTRRRRSPARRRTTRRRTTRRRKSPARRRRVSRRRTTRSRKMSMKGLYNFVVKNMTAFEAIAALGVGLVAGLKLPALAERAVAKIMGRSITLTDGWKGPLVGAALTGALGYALYGMKLVNFNVASTIALAGATVGMMNLASNYFNLPLPGFATIGGFGGLLGGSNTLHENVSAFGYLGEAPFEPFGMSDGAHGYHDMGRVVNVF